MKKALFILAATSLSIIIGGLIFIHFYVSGDRVSEYAGEILGDDFEVSVLKASLNPFTRSLYLEGVSIYSEENEPENLIFEAEKISLRNVGIISAIQGKIRAKELRMDQIMMDQGAFPEHVETGADDDDEHTPDFELHLDHIYFSNGEIRFLAAEDGTGIVNGMNLQAGPIHYRPGCSDCDEWTVEDLWVDVSEIDFTFWNDRYKLQVESILISEADSLFETGGLILKSQFSDEDFFESLDYRTDLFDVNLSGLNLKGFDLPGIMKGERLAGSLLALDSLDLHITFDKRVPQDPDRGVPPMPLEALNNFAFEIALDSVKVHHADIRYSEYDEESVRPGTILFAEIQAVIQPLHSNSEKAVVLTAKSLLEGSGELDTEIRFSMENGVSVTEVKGGLGTFDATHLNNIFKDLEGIEITSGAVHSISFEYIMQGEEASGWISMFYEDLSIDMIDRDDHERGFRDRVGGFFMDQIAVRADSRNNGEEHREGEISEEQEPENGFFNYLWISLRSGIMDVVRRV
ncbi:MAG: hypothetical protein EA390_15060 [Balneolaceae bacterium]|nr:MAG: hypothetical protein EA390_15060 [Balneolaceae bacterium]